MHINLRNLEAINELPLEKVILNQNQLRRLEAIDRWLREIRDSEEFRQLEYSPDVMIGDAIQAVGELLDEHEHCDFKPLNFTYPEWHSYLEQKPVMHIRRVIPWRKKINSFILDAASEVAIMSLLTTSFMVVGTIFCHGVDRIEQSKGEEYQPTWIYNAKIFEGSAIASISVFLGASLTGACVAGDKNDD
ncbi:hypothetical protein H6G97_26980 [Nostoc flagelliforme FACHB-838]|uniref:Uncharacterized protein n=1 Tax=Nostoc flagelliforme FACHB-838 TaxID=2692904 RepID=A0ABR8DUE4_9NOSO|nr:hypothetical protein [Nostoc flagelliforme]MBD2533019.1 hypothetical protein [Nostoc flagelliforme FACHB-838]